MSNDFIAHYGTPRHSGRYPWGSGENPYQRLKDFQSTYNRLHSEEKMTEKQIADYFGVTVNELRAKRSISTQTEKYENIIRATRLHNKGYGWTKIAEIMGAKNESTVRGWVQSGLKSKASKNIETANQLKKLMTEGKCYLDVSKGVENELGITANQLKIATEILKQQGYTVQRVDVKQVTNPKQFTSTLVLAPEGVTKYDIINNIDKVHSVEAYTPDAGSHWFVPEYPKSIDRSRIYVRWNEEGGADKDGVIELRPGVKDLSLGNSMYSQVRIAVDGCDASNPHRYMKGMAVYSDSIPDGYDVVLNSNKHREDGDGEAFKAVKNELDADLAFGAKIKAQGQYHYTDDDGKEQLGAINKVNEEGDWQKWKKSLPSQFLSKQPKELIKKQLDLTYADMLAEYDEIMKISNPVVKQNRLNSFAEDCDSAAVELKAAALPGQQSHSILPINSLKEDEVFAPNYPNGQVVVLVRFPHGGIFEIPRLKVNNRNKEGLATIGANSADAIGIHHKVAEVLSGADFDGDSVLVIPETDKVKIKNMEPLAGLKNFNPSEAYPAVPGMKVMTKQNTQREMGIISNLITDMTLKGAPFEDIERAVKHSMVVIDAEKHKLNYKQSEIDNGIKELKRRYQMKEDGTYGGASTLISLASSEEHVPERTTARTDPETGKKVKSWSPNKETGEWEYMDTGAVRRVAVKDKDGNYLKDENGNQVYKEEKVLSKVKRMANVKDARELSSGTIAEELYADFANKCKFLGNTARKDAMAIQTPKKNPSAEEKYKAEVESLNYKLADALKHAPREREAQRLATIAMREIFENNPQLDKKEIKKAAQYQITLARAKVGAHKKSVQIEIEPKEWEAIQAGAISGSRLREILKHANEQTVLSYAAPKQGVSLSTAQINRIKAMGSSGYTNNQIAEAIGISPATVTKYLKGR